MSSTRALQIFHILRQIALILISILLAKSTLTATDIGHYEALLYIGYALTFFWVTGLIQGILITYPSLSEQEQSIFFTQIYGLFTGISLLLCSILFLGQSYIPFFFTNQAQLPYFQLFTLYLTIQLPTYLVENFHLLKQQNIKIVQYGVLTFVLHLIAVLLPIFLGYGLQGSFYGLILFAIAKHLWLWAILYRFGTWAWNFFLIKKWLIAAAPLMAYAFINSFALTFDNWLVGWWYAGDAQQFAIFRYGARELPLALVMASAFSTAMLPEVTKNIPEALNIIKTKSLKLFHLLFPISILGLLLSYPLFPLIFSSEFTNSAAVFNVYLLILISRLTFPHTIIIGKKESVFMTKISILELFINIIASLALVPYLGLTGIALGTVIAYGFEKVAHIIYLKRQHGIHFGDYTHQTWYWTYSLILIFVYIGVEFFY